MNRQQRRATEKLQRKGQSTLFDSQLAKAMTLHREGKLAEAEIGYSTILKSIPQQPDANHFLGVLLHQSGRSELAIDFIKRAISVNPNYTDAYNNLGNVFKETGDLAHASEAYRKVIELSPNHSAALNNLGVVLKELGEFDEAVQVIHQAIALEPNRADFYHNLGNAHRKQGDLKKSVEACRHSIALQPYQADAYKSLWRTLYLAREFEEAAEALRQWLDHDPKNAVAKHTYAAYRGGDLIPERASDDYVQQTFDSFAGSFDHVLEKLEYRAPHLVAESVGHIYPNPAAELIILDAGCGTGLCGPLLQAYSAKLIGVDLSPKMLAKAEGRGVYQELVVAELVAYLDQHPSTFDLIVSADTLVYFGELRPFIKAAKNALRLGGHLIFTLEKGDDNQNFKLNIHGRYSHSHRYVENALIASGLTVCAMNNEVLRKEAGQPVLGVLVTAQLIKNELRK